MGAILEKLKALFSGPTIDVVLVGLENCGKTTLLNQLSMGEAFPTAPTIGLNVKQVKKGGVNMKVWDMGGQIQYRPEWSRYARGADAIIFMVDVGKKDALSISKQELHALLEDQGLNGIPMLVVGNKIDVKPHLNQEDIITGLNLDYIATSPWAVTMVSALNGTNISDVIDWLIKRSKSKK